MISTRRPSHFGRYRLEFAKRGRISREASAEVIVGLLPIRPKLNEFGRIGSASANNGKVGPNLGQNCPHWADVPGLCSSRIGQVWPRYTAQLCPNRAISCCGGPLLDNSPKLKSYDSAEVGPGRASEALTKYSNTTQTVFSAALGFGQKP